MGYGLGRWQELALVFDEFSITDSGRVRLLVLDTFDHLVQVERDRQFLSRVSVGIHNEEVTFLILGPESTLIQVDGVDARSAFDGHTEELEEVVIIIDSELFLVTDLVEVSTLGGGNYNDFSVLSNLDYGVVVSADEMDQTTAEAVVATKLLLFEVGLDGSLIGEE
jgi:hypothetical protein